MGTRGVAIPQIRKAEKRRVKLKMGISGPSGSGKTWGALALATNLWPNAKICLVDTENESASLYADQFTFDTIPLSPPYGSDRYAACIKAAVAGGYDVLIMDSISHQWDGEGGILRRKEELDQRPGANSYTNWSKFTPEHTGFIEAIKQAPIHIIATMRSKQDYVLTDNDKGKKTPVKVGMAPVQREGLDYEFSIVFDVQMDHKAVTSKNRTGLFGNSVINIADPDVAAAIRTWLESGKAEQEAEQEAKPEPERVPANPAKTAAPTVQGETRSVLTHISEVTDGSKPGKKPFRWVEIITEGKKGIETLICENAELFNTLDKARTHDAKIDILRLPNAKYPRLTAIHEVQ